tara:strand:+ start:781 stop:1299 length:519 start_codon:yes stop_codon:yes gene_type:complete
MTITVGTKIKVTNTKYSTVPNGSIMTVTFAHRDGDIEATLDGGDGFEWFIEAGEYEVLEEDTQDTPTLWKDMTPEEKGALLLANHEGKAIEWYRSFCLKWETDDNFDPSEQPDIAYRIAPPKPVVEAVDVYLKANKHGKWIGSESPYTMTHSITFDTIDGVPDTESIKMFEV